MEGVVRESEERGDSGKLEGGNGVVVRVLVVDDSPLERRVVEALLKSYTSGAIFHVIAVDSGKKAMEILGLEGKAKSPTVSDQKIDIILTDYCMPEMSGYDLLKAVKEQNCPKSIPVVVMSSENEPQRISRCRAIGAEDFILKPLQSKDVHRLRNYVRPTVATHKAGTKRKVPSDFRPETTSSERKSRIVGLAVA